MKISITLNGDKNDNFYCGQKNKKNYLKRYKKIFNVIQEIIKIDDSQRLAEDKTSKIM